jgi:hypothetical protein
VGARVVNRGEDNGVRKGQQVAQGIRRFVRSKHPDDEDEPLVLEQAWD